MAPLHSIILEWHLGINLVEYLACEALGLPDKFLLAENAYRRPLRAWRWYLATTLAFRAGHRGWWLSGIGCSRQGRTWQLQFAVV